MDSRRNNPLNCYDFLFVIDGMELLDKDTYESIGTEQFHVVHLSDGTEKSLLFEAGNSIPVKYEEREKYARLVRKARMLECAKQVFMLTFHLIVNFYGKIDLAHKSPIGNLARNDIHFV